MDFNQYVAQMKAEVTSIEASQKFWIQHEFYPAVASRDIEEMEADIREEEGMQGFRVANPIRDFYQSANGFRFSWKYLKHTDSERVTVANTHISLLSEIYEPEDEEGKSRKLLYENRRLFDRNGPENHVYMKFDEGQDEPRLYYFHAASERYHLLSLDFVGYMERLREARAMSPWQQFFIDDKDFKIDEQRAEQFFQDLALLFPDADASKFRV
ncbi:MAG TPA: hypothetical protein VF666_18430 [Pyrinomonadaceae bacterium]|jgi:hypothetical protein